jgi:hypothetical protein
MKESEIVARLQKVFVSCTPYKTVYGVPVADIARALDVPVEPDEPAVPRFWRHAVTFNRQHSKDDEASAGELLREWGNARHLLPASFMEVRVRFDDYSRWAGYGMEFLATHKTRTYSNGDLVAQGDSRLTGHGGYEELYSR